MLTLTLLALLAQAGDAALTCDRMRHGGVERNPVMGRTCTQVIARKAAFSAPLLVLPRKARTAWTVGLIGGGSLGIGVTIALK